MSLAELMPDLSRLGVKWPRSRSVSIERTVMLCLWCLAILGCFLGWVSKPGAAVHLSAAAQLLDLVRVLTAIALAVVLVLGPGLVLRARPARRHVALGFVPLPGLALLAIAGSIAWAIGRLGWVHPRVVCVLILAPALVWLLVAALRGGSSPMLDPDERGVLLIVAAVLGLTVARSLWSLGPTGELYGGTTNRTLEVGNIPDSRISFQIVDLVANGISPFSVLASSHFLPYTFSDRGPLPGLASLPVIMLTGGHPPAVVDNPPWVPFDLEGFMTYRLAMMVFSATAFLSVWTITRRLGGARAGRFAVLLAATTPFLIHEVWFTWPKMLAASLVLLSAVALLAKRPFLAGLLVGAGYLCHPLALLAVPTLGLIALWPLVGARLRKPHLQQALFLLVGLGLFLIGWRLFNGSHYTQSGFLDYLKQADTAPGVPVTASNWLSDRLVSVGNTLVPMRLFALSSQDPYVNSIYGPSPPIVHFFFQYWYTLPFGIGIVFFPLLLTSVSRALKAWPWAVTSTVLVPFVAFAIWWGAESVGLLPAGLHFWVLTLLAVVALEQRRRRFAWLRQGPVHAVLRLRSVEVLLVAMLPTVVTTHRVIDSHFLAVDVVAVAAMVAFAAMLGSLVWRERADVPDTEGATADAHPVAAERAMWTVPTMQDRQR